MQDAYIETDLIDFRHVRFNHAKEAISFLNYGNVSAERDDYIQHVKLTMPIFLEVKFNDLSEFYSYN